MNLSFWEKDVFTEYDFIVIGSGIVGLSTAIELAEANSEHKILVLEKGIFPTGASTKNAGFACFGSITELLDDLKTLSETEVLELVKMRFEGLKLLRSRLGDTAIDYKHYGGYELISEQLLPCVNKLKDINDLLYPYFKADVFSMADEKIEEFGFSNSFTKHLIYNQFEGQIHTGKMMQSLLAYAQKLGVTILTGAEVENFDTSATLSNQNVSVSVASTTLSSGTSATLSTSTSAWVGEPFDYAQDKLSRTIEFTAKKVAICTNAFTQKFDAKFKNKLDLQPGRGQVLITKPIENLKFKGVFHIDEGYLYMRNYENRVIFGGGRNIAYQEEATTELAITEKITTYLKKYLDEILLPNTPYEIDQQWAGIMAFGANKQPILQEISDNIVLGVRLGGMGVAIGSGLGKEISKKLLK